MSNDPRNQKAQAKNRLGLFSWLFSRMIICLLYGKEVNEMMLRFREEIAVWREKNLELVDQILAIVAEIEPDPVRYDRFVDKFVYLAWGGKKNNQRLEKDLRILKEYGHVNFKYF